VGSWPNANRGRRLHELAAGGLFDREQESAADFVERPALGLHREDFEPHGAQAPSALGFAAGEMAARLDELALHDAAAAFEAPYSFERLMQISLEHENLVRFGDRRHSVEGVTEWRTRDFVRGHWRAPYRDIGTGDFGIARMASSSRSTSRTTGRRESSESEARTLRRKVCAGEVAAPVEAWARANCPSWTTA